LCQTGEPSGLRTSIAAFAPAVPLRGLQAKQETKLLQRGLIHGNSPQGVWHITPQGRIALLDPQGRGCEQDA